MSHILEWDTYPENGQTVAYVVMRPGIRDAHENAATNFSTIKPNGAPARALMAAAKPQKYNLRDPEFSGIRKQAEAIEYERDDITLADARDDPDFRRHLTNDDKSLCDDDDTVLEKHTWRIPTSLPEIR